MSAATAARPEAPARPPRSSSTSDAARRAAIDAVEHRARCLQIATAGLASDVAALRRIYETDQAAR